MDLKAANQLFTFNGEDLKNKYEKIFGDVDPKSNGGNINNEPFQKSPGAVLSVETVQSNLMFSIISELNSQKKEFYAHVSKCESHTEQMPMTPTVKIKTPFKTKNPLQNQSSPESKRDLLHQNQLNSIQERSNIDTSSWKKQNKLSWPRNQDQNSDSHTDELENIQPYSRKNSQKSVGLTNHYFDSQSNNIDFSRGRGPVDDNLMIDKNFVSVQKRYNNNQLTKNKQYAISMKDFTPSDNSDNFQDNRDEKFDGKGGFYIQGSKDKKNLSPNMTNVFDKKGSSNFPNEKLLGPGSSICSTSNNKFIFDTFDVDYTLSKKKEDKQSNTNLIKNRAYNSNEYRESLTNQFGVGLHNNDSDKMNMAMNKDNVTPTKNKYMKIMGNPSVTTSTKDNKSSYQKENNNNLVQQSNKSNSILTSDTRKSDKYRRQLIVDDYHRVSKNSNTYFCRQSQCSTSKILNSNDKNSGAKTSPTPKQKMHDDNYDYSNSSAKINSNDRNYAKISSNDRNYVKIDLRKQYFDNTNLNINKNETPLKDSINFESSTKAKKNINENSTSANFGNSTSKKNKHKSRQTNSGNHDKSSSKSAINQINIESTCNNSFDKGNKLRKGSNGNIQDENSPNQDSTSTNTNKRDVNLSEMKNFMIDRSFQDYYPFFKDKDKINSNNNKQSN